MLKARSIIDERESRLKSVVPYLAIKCSCIVNVVQSLFWVHCVESVHSKFTADHTSQTSKAIGNLSNPTRHGDQPEENQERLGSTHLSGRNVPSVSVVS